MIFSLHDVYKKYDDDKKLVIKPKKKLQVLSYVLK